MSRTTRRPGTTEPFSRARIDALLTDTGWNLTDGVSVLLEHTLPGSSRADYALCDRAARPMAVVKAKYDLYDESGPAREDRTHA